MTTGRVPGDAIHAAAVAMAQVETGPDGTMPNDIDFLLARIALEAAAPVILKDMRRMTSVEIAARNRPEQIEAARAKVRTERKEAMAERMRAAREAAWEEGMMDQFEADLLGKPSPDNPYKSPAP